MKIYLFLQGVKKSVKFRKIVFLSIIYIILVFPQPIAAGGAFSQSEFKQMIHQPYEQPNNLWSSLYEGIDADLMPEYIENYDKNMKKWETVEEIYNGVKISNLIEKPNSSRDSRDKIILTTEMKNYLVNKLFSLRSDFRDVWWNNFEKSMLAYITLNDLQFYSMGLHELNVVLNNSLKLYEYYENIAYEKINDSMSWKDITLRDLIKYRIKDFISYKGISVNYLDENYYNFIDKAIDIGLIDLQDLKMSGMFSQALIEKKDKLINEKIVNKQSETAFEFKKSLYTEMYNGKNNTIKISPPTYLEQFNQIFGSNSGYYFNKIKNYQTPLKLSFIISSIPDTLIQKKYYEAGLIYYTQKEGVNYTISTPNDHWDYNANGTLIYVHETLNQTAFKYSLIQGSWIDEYTFVPENTSIDGTWQWNDSVIDQPNAYKLEMELNGENQFTKNVPLNEVSDGYIDYTTVIPSLGLKSDINIRIKAYQLVINLTKNEERIFDEELYYSMIENTTIINNKTYYSSMGILYDDYGWEILDSYGIPVGAIEVNNSYLKELASSSTYSYSYYYEDIGKINFTLLISIPDLFVCHYNSNEMRGDLAFYKEDLNNYGIQIYNGKNDQLQMVQKYSKYYEYSINPDLNSNSYDSEETFIIFYKDYLDLTDEIIYSNEALDYINEDNMTMTIQSYFFRVNHEPEQYLLLEPFLTYDYYNYTFKDIHQYLNLFSRLIDDTLGPLKQNLVNEYMEWAWQWYNQTSGFFRNSIIETVNVLKLYSQYESLLTETNKLTFFDVLTLINSTLQNYAYQYYDITERSNNASIISVDYPAENMEGEIERKYNLIKMLEVAYSIYDNLSVKIVTELINRNITSDYEVKNIISAEYNQRHETGNELNKSIMIIQGQNAINQTSAELQANVNRISEEMAKQQIINDELLNNPNLRYALIERSVSYNDIGEKVKLLTDFGLQPEDAIKLITPTKGGNLPKLSDGAITLLRILSPDLHQTEKIPSTNYIENNPDLYWLINKVVFILLMSPLLTSILYKSRKEIAFMFGIYAMFAMVIEVGAMSFNSTMDILNSFLGKLLVDYAKVAENGLVQLGTKDYLTVFFGKQLANPYEYIHDLSSTRLLYFENDHSKTSLAREYDNYVNEIQHQRDFLLILESQRITTLLGVGGSIPVLSYEEWIIENYKNIQGVRVQAEIDAVTEIVMKDQMKQNEEYQIKYANYMKTKQEKANIVGQTDSWISGATNGLENIDKAIPHVLDNALNMLEKIKLKMTINTDEFKATVKEIAAEIEEVKKMSKGLTTIDIDENIKGIQTPLEYENMVRNVLKIDWTDYNVVTTKEMERNILKTYLLLASQEGIDQELTQKAISRYLEYNRVGETVSEANQHAIADIEGYEIQNIVNNNEDNLFQAITQLENNEIPIFTKLRTPLNVIKKIGNSIKESLINRIGCSSACLDDIKAFNNHFDPDLDEVTKMYIQLLRRNEIDVDQMNDIELGIVVKEIKEFLLSIKDKGEFTGEFTLDLNHLVNLDLREDVFFNKDHFRGVLPSTLVLSTIMKILGEDKGNVVKIMRRTELNPSGIVTFKVRDINKIIDIELKTSNLNSDMLDEIKLIKFILFDSVSDKQTVLSLKPGDIYYYGNKAHLWEGIHLPLVKQKVKLSDMITYLYNIFTLEEKIGLDNTNGRPEPSIRRSSDFGAIIYNYTYQGRALVLKIGKYVSPSGTSSRAEYLVDFLKNFRLFLMKLFLKKKPSSIQASLL